MHFKQDAMLQHTFLSTCYSGHAYRAGCHAAGLHEHFEQVATLQYTCLNPSFSGHALRAGRHAAGLHEQRAAVDQGQLNRCESEQHAVGLHVEGSSEALCTQLVLEYYSMTA